MIADLYVNVEMQQTQSRLRPHHGELRNFDANETCGRVGTRVGGGTLHCIAIALLMVLRIMA